MGADHLIPGLIGKADAEKDVAKIGKIKSEMFTLHFLPKVKPFPKVRALLNHLNKAGFVLSVASSADTDELNKLLHIADVEDLLHCIVSSNDVAHSKPDPDLICTAIKKMKLDPAEVLMVGDTPYDIRAANKAGVKTIAFRCGGWNDHALKNAEVLFDGPWEMLMQVKNSHTLESWNKHESFSIPQKVLRYFLKYPAQTIAIGSLIGSLIKNQFSNKKRNKGWDRQFAGAYPRDSGAISAVTGGPPEDMNEMPATGNLNKGSVYDGTDLNRAS
jgi:HAD superfamily hydrolase (TIGR01509 family)